MAPTIDRPSELDSRTLLLKITMHLGCRTQQNHTGAELEASPLLTNLYNVCIVNHFYWLQDLRRLQSLPRWEILSEKDTRHYQEANKGLKCTEGVHRVDVNLHGFERGMGICEQWSLLIMKDSWISLTPQEVSSWEVNSVLLTRNLKYRERREGSFLFAWIRTRTQARWLQGTFNQGLHHLTTGDHYGWWVWLVNQWLKNRKCQKTVPWHLDLLCVYSYLGLCTSSSNAKCISHC